MVDARLPASLRVAPTLAADVAALDAAVGTPASEPQKPRSPTRRLLSPDDEKAGDDDAGESDDVADDDVLSVQQFRRDLVESIRHMHEELRLIMHTTLKKAKSLQHPGGKGRLGWLLNTGQRLLRNKDGTHVEQGASGAAPGSAAAQPSAEAMLANSESGGGGAAPAKPKLPAFMAVFDDMPSDAGQRSDAGDTPQQGAAGGGGASDTPTTVPTPTTAPTPASDATGEAAASVQGSDASSVAVPSGDSPTATAAAQGVVPPAGGDDHESPAAQVTEAAVVPGGDTHTDGGGRERSVSAPRRRSSRTHSVGSDRSSPVVLSGSQRSRSNSAHEKGDRAGYVLRLCG